MEVRGTKLVLHKPRGDRHCTAGVHELSAVGVVEDAEGGDEGGGVEEDGADGGGQRREPVSMGRKKRAYWGRGRHPALGFAAAGAFALGGMLSSQGMTMPRGPGRKVDGGGACARARFALAFLQTLCEAEAARQEEEWRDHALTVLLCLSLLVGRARVEAEVVRCGVLRLGRRAGGERPGPRARGVVLAWEYFRAETIPDVYLPALQPATSGIPASVYSSNVRREEAKDEPEEGK
ncbi:hypothetical protein B0H11DRAFT_2239384 [Mycena galericulata]|nr:hypothetical protein B0H11DRAFT_2239384 [Mycena galericulata]